MTTGDMQEVRILCGEYDEDPFGRQAGTAVHLDVTSTGDTGAAAAAAPVSLPRGAAFRHAPLLAIIDIEADRLMVVGSCQITVERHAVPLVRVLVRGLWVSSSVREPAPSARRRGPARSGDANRRWRMVDDFDGLRRHLATWLRGNPHVVPADAEGRATVIAKAIAESSRNEVATIREMRYEMERTLGANLRRLRTQELEFVLADIVELNVAVGRARDEATEAWRGGLASWRTALPAYHAQRRLQDPTLPRRPRARWATRRSWFPILDAGVRQCRAMDQLLAEESTLLRHLLDAGATVSVARDAQAQEKLTMVATVGGVLIGIPALIIALYGATAVLPINISNSVVLLPVAFAGVVAGLMAAFLPGRSRAGKVDRFLVTLLATAVTIILLAMAGSLVSPGRR